MGMIARTVTAALVTLALVAGTGAPAAGKGKGKAEAKSKDPPISAAAREEASKFFATVCFTCHGPKGDGDGPGAAALNPKPRKFSDPTWQKVVKNAEIEKAILEGGASVGKSQFMPPNPQLKDKPEVILALRDMVRAFGK